jgi:hypothetical protein
MEPVHSSENKNSAGFKTPKELNYLHYIIYVYVRVFEVTNKTPDDSGLMEHDAESCLTLDVEDTTVLQNVGDH